jgi:hypothetical protein
VRKNVNIDVQRIRSIPLGSRKPTTFWQARLAGGDVSNRVGMGRTKAEAIGQLVLLLDSGFGTHGVSVFTKGFLDLTAGQHEV